MFSWNKSALELSSPLSSPSFFSILGLKEITVSSWPVKRYSRRRSWTQYEKPECQSSPDWKRSVSFSAFLRSTLFATKRNNCVRSCRQSLFSVIPDSSNSFERTCALVSTLSFGLQVKSLCLSPQMDSDLRQSCCFPPSSLWPQHLSDNSLKADARWVVKRFRTDNVCASPETCPWM